MTSDRAAQPTRFAIVPRYGAPEELKTCDQVVCGANATCGGEDAACFCDAGYSGNPYDGCVATMP